MAAETEDVSCRACRQLPAELRTCCADQALLGQVLYGDRDNSEKGGEMPTTSPQQQRLAELVRIAASTPPLIHRDEAWPLALAGPVALRLLEELSAWRVANPYAHQDRARLANATGVHGWPQYWSKDWHSLRAALSEEELKLAEVFSRDGPYANNLFLELGLARTRRTATAARRKLRHVQRAPLRFLAILAAVAAAVVVVARAACD